MSRKPAGLKGYRGSEVKDYRESDGTYTLSILEAFHRVEVESHANIVEFASRSTCLLTQLYLCHIPVSVILDDRCTRFAPSMGMNE